jgi:tetratricopeptide (TPR) repeat protein
MNVLGMAPDKITGDDLLKPDNPEFHFISGIECMKKGAYAEAEACFRQTLRLVPESLETLLNLGYAFDMQGRSEEAFNCYEAVLALSPENAKAHYNRANHLLRAGNLINGFAEYEFRFAE